jgi:rare lipoprotein A
VRVTNLENGRSVVVRINDRGPYARGRLIDVSKHAAVLLGFIGRGTARVRVETLPKESREIAEAAKGGMDTSRLTMEELDRYNTPASPAPTQEAAARPVIASAQAEEPPTKFESGAGSNLPESLQTPTITVEQLSTPAKNAPGSASSPEYSESRPVPASERHVLSTTERGEFVNRLGLSDKSGATDSSGMVTGRLKKGHFMPDAVVSQEQVAPTGIFVQAGAFAVKANADRMKESLGSIAPVVIESVTVKGRLLYRVKLGPIASVEKADKVLEKVIAAGDDGAHVVHH